MVINQRRINTTRVADLQRLQVGLERVPEEHGGGGRGEDGEDVGLDGVEGGGGGGEGVGGDAGPAREVVGDGLGGLDERVVDDDAGGVVDEADAGELLAALRDAALVVQMIDAAFGGPRSVLNAARCVHAGRNG